jgi:cytochrome c-type biogenesis protein
VLLALIVAFGSGVVSFLAPCTVPLLPAYVGVLSGSSNGVPPEQQGARLLRGSLLYVVGFATVFVALGVAAGSVGRAVRESGGPVQRIGGGLVLVLAVLLIVESQLGLLARLLPAGDRGRGRLARSNSALAPLVLGVVFATAFTPCVGPFLGATLTVAATGSGAVRGGVLLAAYALGLGVPFVIASLALSGTPGLARTLNRWSRPVSLVGGVLLALLGLTLLTGRYGDVSGLLARANPFS